MERYKSSKTKLIPSSPRAWIFVFLVRCLGGSSTVKLLICFSEPPPPAPIPRLSLLSPGPPPPRARETFAFPLSLGTLAFPPSPPGPAFPPARLQPHDRKGSTTRRHPRPRPRPLPPFAAPHAKSGRRRGERGRRAPRSPTRARQSAAAAAAAEPRAGSRMCGARGSPAPAAGSARPRPPPRCAPLSPPSPALPLFRALRLRVSASHCSESVTAPERARVRGCSPRAAWPPLPLSPSFLSLPLLAVSPPALSVSESRP